MTISVGWRDGENVFVVADSLLTYAGAGTVPTLRPDSTFLEASRQDADRRSHETGCKVFSLGSGVVASYAGASSAAVGSLKQIRAWLDAGESLRSIMRGITSGSDRENFRILLGGGPKGDPQLYCLRSDGSWQETYEDRVPVVLGSLPAEGKDFVRRTILTGYDLPPLCADPDHLLATVLMNLQALGRRVDLTQDKAGGAFFGMRSAAGSVHSQRDILYVAFSKSELAANRGIEFALVGIRDEALMAWPLDRNVAIFTSDVTPKTDAQIEEIVRESDLPIETPPFICLLEKRVGALIGIDCRKAPPAKFVTLKLSETGYQATFQPAVMSYVNRIPEPTPVLPPVVLQSFLVEPNPPDAKPGPT